jgi:hypothetical protein
MLVKIELWQKMGSGILLEIGNSEIQKDNLEKNEVANFKLSSFIFILICSFLDGQQ